MAASAGEALVCAEALQSLSEFCWSGHLCPAVHTRALSFEGGRMLFPWPFAGLEYAVWKASLVILNCSLLCSVWHLVNFKVWVLRKVLENISCHKMQCFVLEMGITFQVAVIAIFSLNELDGTLHWL